MTTAETAWAATPTDGPAMDGVRLAGLGAERERLELLATRLEEGFALVVQAIASIAAPIAGAGPTGDPLEYWTYLVTALLIPPAAVLWALVDRHGEWQTLIVGIGILACAVMVYRMHQIWFVQAA